MQVPRRLTEGDKIGLIATSGNVDIKNLKEGISELKKMGLEIELGKSCISKYGYLAGTDEIRAKDINDMFRREDIKGILVARGGYGVNRLVDLLDYECIKDNPKFFGGYSDVTGLHIIFNQRCKMVTYHTPMVSTEISKGLNSYAKEYLQWVMFSNDKLKIKNPESERIEKVVGGKVEGIIIGGNLSLVVKTLGTKYEIDTKEKVLLLEDVGEEPYKIDGMLNQLKMAGKFKDSAGIVFGQFTNCIAKDVTRVLSFNEILKDIVIPENKPTIKNLYVGHCKNSMSLPLGVKVELNADECELIIK